MSAILLLEASAPPARRANAAARTHNMRTGWLFIGFPPLLRKRFAGFGQQAIGAVFEYGMQSSSVKPRERRRRKGRGDGAFDRLVLLADARKASICARRRRRRVMIRRGLTGRTPAVSRSLRFPWMRRRWVEAYEINRGLFRRSAGCRRPDGTLGVKKSELTLFRLVLSEEPGAPDAAAECASAAPPP